MADINVTEEIIDINVTEEVVNIIAPLGGYPLPNTINSVFGRVGNIVATEGDYTLTQLGDVTLTSPANGQVLKYNGTTWVNDSDSGITGTGTTNTLPKFTGASTIGNSNISDSGTLITLGSNTTISSGSLGIGTTSLTGISLAIAKNITGGTNGFGILQQGVVQSDVTNTAFGIINQLNTQAATFNINEYRHFNASQSTIGAGSSIGTQMGFLVSSNLTAATINYGFRGLIPSGSNRWNLYMDGTANNYLAGSLGIGSTSLTDTTLNIAKNITGAATYFVVRQSGVVQSDANTNILAFNNQLNTQATSFVLTQYIHYNATQGTIGAGSSVGTNTGFNVSPSMIGGTNNYGFRSGIPVGAGRWNLFIDGTAANFLAGDTGIGTQSLGTATMLTIGGTETAVSAISRGQLINTTLVASANSDNLIGLDIAPTFTNGAFTGVTNAAIRVGGNIINNSGYSYSIGTSGNPFASVFAVNFNSPANLNLIAGQNAILNAGNTSGLQMFQTTRNIVIQNGGTFTDAGFRLDVNGTTRLNGSTTITGSTTATSGIGRGELNSATLVASANNDVLVGLDIQNTFTNGAFTGVSNFPLRIRNTTNTGNILTMDSTGNMVVSGSLGVGTVYGNGDINLSSGSGNLNLKTGYNVNTGAVMFNATRNLLLQNGGTFTDNGFRLDVQGSFRQSGSITAASALAVGSTITPTLVAAANNDVLVGMDINPTFTNGAFTGVNNIGLRLINNETVINNPTGRPSPQLQLNGGLWNSGLGAVRMSAALQVMTFQVNTNPTISKLSFQVGTDNAAPAERMYVTSNGLFGINGGANFTAGTGSFFNDITLTQTGGAQGSPASSNRLVLKGNAHNSTQGLSPSMGYLQMINVIENANPTTDKLSFFVGSASSANTGNVVGNATERLAIRTDGIFSYFNLAGTEFLRLIGSTGNLLIQNGGTFTDAGFRLDVNGTARFTGNTTFNANLLLKSGGVETFNNPQYTDVYFSSYYIYTHGAFNIGLSALDTGYINFSTGSTEKARFFNSGNLLIQNGGTFTDIPTARLAVNSTTQGFLPPRMTTTQKNAIGTPAAGLMVYDTTLNQMSYYNGTTWINF